MNSLIGNQSWRIKITLAAFVAAGMLGGCAPAEEETTSAISNPPVGIVDDDAGFYVQHVASENYTYVTHKGTNYASSGSLNYTGKCKVAVGEDNICFVEGDELDLYFWGVTLQYNVPSSMCDYLSFIPPYYYRYPAGTGPTTVRYRTDAAGAIIDEANSSGGTPVCAYDYSKREPAGPNCCSGPYSLSVGTTDSNGLTSYVPTPGTWGGKPGNCLGGPAITTQTLTSDGFPKADLYFVSGQGINKTYDVASPIGQSYGTNIYVADYFTSTNFATSTTWPRAFSSTQLATPTLHTPYTRATKPYYEWVCYDRAHEAKARLRVMIRSWDKIGMTGVLASYANTPGIEPIYGGNYHDFAIWDDIAPLGAGYETGYPETLE